MKSKGQIFTILVISVGNSANIKLVNPHLKANFNISDAFAICVVDPFVGIQCVSWHQLDNIALYVQGSSLGGLVILKSLLKKICVYLYQGIFNWIPALVERSYSFSPVCYSAHPFIRPFVCSSVLYSSFSGTLHWTPALAEGSYNFSPVCSSFRLSLRFSVNYGDFSRTIHCFFFNILHDVQSFFSSFVA